MRKRGGLLPLVVSLALAFGLPMQALQVSAMSAMMEMPAAGDMTSSHACEGCVTGNDGMSSATCAAQCSGIHALPVLAVAFDNAAPSRLIDMVEPILTGHGDPPDPHPPR